MPDATRAVSGIPRANPGGRVTPRFWHRLNRFRHFCGGSLALAFLDRACWDLVPAFPQRSPPRLLTAAACGGLRSAPDRRTRRALLHLSYSCAPQTTDAALVTHVESPGGISPPGAPRTVHDSLESHGSRCSAVALNGFASSTGSSRFQLANGQGRTTQPLRSSPITGPSTLLRAAPPLRHASVLSPSRLEPLAASPFTPSA